MKNRRVLVAIILIMSFIISGGIFIFNKFIRTQNVFDQIYYTRMDMSWLSGDFSFDKGYYSGLFSNMRQTESGGYIDAKTYWETYKPEYLNPNTTLIISFFPADDDKSGRLFIEYAVNTDSVENRTWYCYEYDLSDKTLSYTSNDPNNTENRMFLYDIFLEDWFEANPNTRFSISGLGNYIFIDET